MQRLTVLVLVALLAACSSKAKLREPTPLQDVVNPQLNIKTAWTVQAGEGSGKYYTALRPAVSGDGVFTADINGVVQAFDPASGKRLWRVKTNARIVSGPTLAANTVLMGTMDGEIIALKRTDGAPYWRAQMPSEALAAPSGDGTLVIARSSDGQVQALSAVSGQRVWSFDRTVPNLTLRGLGKALIDDNIVYIGMDNGRVAALHMRDGQPMWEQLITVPGGRNELERLNDVDGAMLLDGADLFIASFGGEVVRADRNTGQVQWRHAVKSFTGPVRAGDVIVVSDEAGVVWGLDRYTGAATWRNEDLKYRRLSGAQVFEGHVVVGDYQGYLHWLDPKDGRLVARNRVGSKPIRATPVVADGRLYIENQQGKVAALTVH